MDTNNTDGLMAVVGIQKSTEAGEGRREADNQTGRIKTKFPDRQAEAPTRDRQNLVNEAGWITHSRAGNQAEAHVRKRRQSYRNRQGQTRRVSPEAKVPAGERQGSATYRQDDTQAGK